MARARFSGPGVIAQLSVAPRLHICGGKPSESVAARTPRVLDIRPSLPAVCTRPALPPVIDDRSRSHSLRHRHLESEECRSPNPRLTFAKVHARGGDLGATVYANAEHRIGCSGAFSLDDTVAGDMLPRTAESEFAHSDEQQLECSGFPLRLEEDLNVIAERHVHRTIHIDRGPINQVDLLNKRVVKTRYALHERRQRVLILDFLVAEHGIACLLCREYGTPDQRPL